MKNAIYGPLIKFFVYITAISIVVFSACIMGVLISGIVWAVGNNAFAYLLLGYMLRGVVFALCTALISFVISVLLEFNKQNG